MLSTFAFIAPYLRIICISLFLIYSGSITNAFASCSSNCHLIIVNTLLPSVVLRADVKIYNSLKNAYYEKLYQSSYTPKLYTI